MSAPKEKLNIVTAFVMDFETGGLDCVKNAATQLSAYAVRLDTFEIMDKFNEYIRPYEYKEDIGKSVKKTLKTKYETKNVNLMNYDIEALDVSGISMDTLYKKGIELTQVCEDFLDFIKKNTLDVGAAFKPIFVGHNILFDLSFLEQIFTYTGLWNELAKLMRCTKDLQGNSQIYYIDTIEYAQLAFGNVPDMNSFKLELVAERLGVEVDDAHDADADVMTTLEVLKVLTGRMRSGISDGDTGMVDTKKTKTREHFKI